MKSWMKFVQDTSKMLGHTSAEHPMQLTLDVLEECSLLAEKFANISTDGPNINKSLHKKLDSKLKESYLHQGLSPFNPCNLHKCHNAFCKCITIYGKDSENLTFDLHAWFKISPRTSFKLSSNCKAWNIFPRTKHFSTAMLKHDD